MVLCCSVSFQVENDGLLLLVLWLGGHKLSCLETSLKNGENRFCGERERNKESFFWTVCYTQVSDAVRKFMCVFEVWRSFPGFIKHTRLLLHGSLIWFEFCCCLFYVISMMLKTGTYRMFLYDSYKYSGTCPWSPVISVFFVRLCNWIAHESLD